MSTTIGRIEVLPPSIDAEEYPTMTGRLLK
jgi:hypothetical protein